MALAAVVIGGLPIGLATLSFALAHKRRDILKLLAVPLLALGAQACMVALLSALSVGWLPASLPIANVGAGQAPRIGNTLLRPRMPYYLSLARLPVRRRSPAVARGRIGTQRFRALSVRIVVQPYRFALFPATIAALAMAGTVAA